MRVPSVRIDYLCEAIAATMIVAALLVAGGCGSTARTSDDVVAPVEFGVAASADDIIAGEIITFSTRSANTLGRDAEVEWTTTGGELETERNGRIARVKFDQPGRYTVSATLRVDEQIIRSDSVTVEVRPIR